MAVNTEKSRAGGRWRPAAYAIFLCVEGVKSEALLLIEWQESAYFFLGEAESTLEPVRSHRAQAPSCLGLDSAEPRSKVADAVSRHRDDDTKPVSLGIFGRSDQSPVQERPAKSRVLESSRRKLVGVETAPTGPWFNGGDRVEVSILEKCGVSQVVAVRLKGHIEDVVHSDRPPQRGAELLSLHLW